MEHMTLAPLNAPDTTLKAILDNVHTVAIIGLSDNPARPSYGVAVYLQRQGYQIVPITPKPAEILGVQAYPDLLSVPFDVDIVTIFRRPELVDPHVDEVIQKGAKALWMQLGVVHAAAAQRARQAGIPVFMDRCLAIDHSRAMGTPH